MEGVAPARTVKKRRREQDKQRYGEVPTPLPERKRRDAEKTT